MQIWSNFICLTPSTVNDAKLRTKKPRMHLPLHVYMYTHMYTHNLLQKVVVSHVNLACWLMEADSLAWIIFRLSDT